MSNKQAFGSINNMFAGSTEQTPVVGMGATRISWTDRTPFTVVEIKSERMVVVQEDDAERADKNGMSESQDYTFTSNSNNPKTTITRRKDGSWQEKGGSTKFVIGYRSKYHDYSF